MNTGPMKGEFSDIPTVSVSSLRGAAAALDSDPERRSDTVAQLRDALERVGFAYIVDHDVPQSLVETVRALAVDFHALPLEAKNRIVMNDAHRGYMPFSTSTIVTSSVAKVVKPNQSESLMVMHELAPDDPDVLAARPMQGLNQWPEELPALRTAVLEYMDRMTALSRDIAVGLAEALGLEPGWFLPHFDRPTLFLRLLHYPPQPDEAELFGSAPHTDYGFITLLAQDDVGGLEVRNRHGEWIAAPPIAGSFVMNVGDILARWSNGRFASTPHRVRNLTGRERYSQPFFFDPSIDAEVACPPGLAGEAPRFKPVRYGDYLVERLDRNYDYRRKRA